ncbi:MAG: membrane protein insertase YidC [Micrococcales bacterium]|nr:membrane protein insertase YidC [Micrococcales bacterium]
MSNLIYPFEWLVAWILYGWHSLLTAIGLPAASGLAWGLSIVGLVVVMRAAMIPLFVKQIHASRRMQLIQPEIQKIQKKYKGKTDPESRQKMTQEQMDLYKKTGTNPFSSCMPILVQSPFFFGLFRVLNSLDDIAKGTVDPIGPISKTLAAQAEKSTMFGAQLSDTFMGADTINTKIVTIVLIILMSVTTFTTQHQLMRKNMPASALDNPFAQQQKMLLYIMPIIFAVSGVNFPIGVLIYWAVTNIWSMVQQFYVIRHMPTPGSPAEQALHARRKARGKEIPTAATLESITKEGLADEGATAAHVQRQRQQPMGKKRAKQQGRKGGATANSSDQAGTDSDAVDRRD